MYWLLLIFVLSNASIRTTELSPSELVLLVSAAINSLPGSLSMDRKTDRRDLMMKSWTLNQEVLFPMTFFFFFFFFYRSSLALQRHSSTEILLDYWGTFCAGVCPMSIVSFLAAAGFEPTSWCIPCGCLTAATL